MSLVLYRVLLFVLWNEFHQILNLTSKELANLFTSAARGERIVKDKGLKLLV